MNRLLFGSALGALAMYFLDPQQGRRRRARTRDKVLHAGKVLNGPLVDKLIAFEAMEGGKYSIFVKVPEEVELLETTS